MNEPGLIADKMTFFRYKLSRWQLLEIIQLKVSLVMKNKLIQAYVVHFQRTTYSPCSYFNHDCIL